MLHMLLSAKLCTGGQAECVTALSLDYLCRNFSNLDVIAIAVT
ncbi:hypothetical protein [Calothrix sp. NIES-2100]